MINTIENNQLISKLPAEQTYVLVDGAVTGSQTIIDTLFDYAEQPEYLKLYQGTEYHSLQEISPVLVKTNQDDPYFFHLTQELVGKIAFIIITSEVDSHCLIHHLQQLISVKASHMGSCYFRYYEPHCLKFLVPTLTPLQVDCLLGPAASWYWPCLQAGQLHQWESIDHKPLLNLTEQMPSFELSDNQLAAFSQAMRWVFIDDQLASHQQTPLLKALAPDFQYQIVDSFINQFDQKGLCTPAHLIVALKACYSLKPTQLEPFFASLAKHHGHSELELVKLVEQTINQLKQAAVAL
ncbi:DUF4123 domain-containing protein [Spartinivicinus ruber]|uniref:DUF4123 domain-containing protein n=1 Tax=Spartinivicinus ruber TaxID=2683272 RepID=UPI0013D66F96|nr:DUF4123 domain-containing protein [Spartinivicinus ruber]